MSGFLLDTNVCINYLNEGNSKLKSKLLQHFAGIYICDIVQMELYYGAYKSQKTTENLERLTVFFDMISCLAFNHDIAKLAGEIRADLDSKGMKIGAYDVLIASSAIIYQKTLVTNNVKEFQRVDGLHLVDWQ